MKTLIKITTQVLGKGKMDKNNLKKIAIYSKEIYLMYEET